MRRYRVVHLSLTLSLSSLRSPSPSAPAVLSVNRSVSVVSLFSKTSASNGQIIWNARGFLSVRSPPGFLVKSRAFPENNQDAMCMRGPEIEGAISEEEKAEEKWHEATDRGYPFLFTFSSSGSLSSDTSPSSSSHSLCPPLHVYLNRTAACVPACRAQHSLRPVSTLLFSFPI